MPKVIELTIEIEVQKASLGTEAQMNESIRAKCGVEFRHSMRCLQNSVKSEERSILEQCSICLPCCVGDTVSCPGVWLCQDGRVSLTMFALGTSYQTCLLPPVFPLTFRDVFYFRKRFQKSCALNNVCCLLKGETIYCELVQWSEDCDIGECVILAQYLGAMNDVLFPPNMCSTDGVDLLMRRSKDFPGILSPKIEIATKVRIDEVWNQYCNISNAAKILGCKCSPRDMDTARQKQVCHSAKYHRHKCVKTLRSRSRSRTRSEESTSCCSLIQGGDVSSKSNCRCSNPMSKSGRRLVDVTPKSPLKACPYQYTVCPIEVYGTWNKKLNQDNSVSDEERDNEQASEPETLVNEERLNKLLLESQYVEQESSDNTNENTSLKRKKYNMKITPCICEICRRYHEIFHSNDDETLIITQNK